ncbi:MAG: hypothetical protein AB8G22_19680 [Saprospiraceae bacterium]
MKVSRLYLSALFSIFYLCSTAQDANVYQWEIGLDMTPIIASPYSSSDNQPGIEFVVRRRLSSRAKLRFRYINNREDSPAVYENGLSFANFQTEPAADGTPRFITNVNYQGNNNGIAIGYQKDFLANGLRMYAGLDLHGQIARGEVWSEVLEEGQLPFPKADAFLFMGPAFTGAINEYNNYQLGLVPTLGIDIPIGQRLNFTIEFGAKISYFQQDLPLIRTFEQLEYNKTSGLFVEANPIKDLIISFRF